MSSMPSIKTRATDAIQLTVCMVNCRTENGQWHNDSKLVRTSHNVKVIKIYWNIWSGIEPDNISLANFTCRYSTDIKDNVKHNQRNNREVNGL